MVVTLAELGVNNYGDPLEEARQCRRDSAVFDFSFMSRARINGPEALLYLSEIQSRDLSNMQAGDIHYCLFTDDAGVVSSDLTVWKFADDNFEIYSGRPLDIELIASGVPDSCTFRDLSNSTSIFSIQGPNSLDHISQLGDRDALEALSYFQHTRISIGGVPCQIGRLGYTGEKGFEIVVEDRAEAENVWEKLLNISRPAGVAAIDILRIEAGFILFLNECRMGCNAAELGLGRFSRSNEPETRVELVCFKANEQTIDMPWSPPQTLAEPGDGEIVVTSSSMSVLCEGILGLGFVRFPCRYDTLYTDLFGRFQGIQIVDFPFYDTSKKIPRSKWHRTISKAL
jgi:glycine cleavage system aminomethyltransferase T